MDCKSDKRGTAAVSSRSFVLFFGALAVGIAIGAFAFGGGDDKSAQDAPKAEKYVARKKIADVGEGASLASLRARIAELERELSAAKAIRPEMPTNEVAGAPRPFERGHGPFEGLRKLRETDPKKYASITNRMEQHRLQRLERARRNYDFLSSVDVSRFSASAKKSHDDLLNLMEVKAELEDKMRDENMSEDERHALMDQLHATDRKMRDLQTKERDTLFEETAKTLGFEGDDVNEITATMREIVNATGNNRGGEMPPPPPSMQGGR